MGNGNSGLWAGSEVIIWEGGGEGCLMEEGHVSPDYKVATDFWIDEEKMSEDEIRLIQTVITDIILILLNNEAIEENEK